MSLDAQLWMENGKAIRLTQDNWIEKYNKANKVMAAPPDFYVAIKENDDAFISVLREDFNNWLALSARIRYNSDNLEGKIIHYYGSTVIEPIETDLVIPILRDTPIEEAIVTGEHAEQGLVYLQAYFGTQDSAEEIIKNLEQVSGKSKDKIRIWTANTQGNYTRAMHPERAAFVGFDLGLDLFSVLGCDFDCDGRSRGVSAGGAWRTADTKVSEQIFPYDIQSGISKKICSVNFSHIQSIGDYEKYTGMFCFKDDRYVVSLMRRRGVNKKINDTKIAQVLARKETTEEKIEKLTDLNPTYAHIAKYHKGKLVDDSEGFKSLKG